MHLLSRYLFQNLDFYYFKFFGGVRYTKLNHRLYRTIVKCLGINNYQNHFVSGEKWMIDCLLYQYGFQNGGVFFDVGSNVGNYAKEIILTYPKINAYLFEPHPVCYNKMEGDSILKSARKFNIALGERNERINFYDNASHLGSEHASIYKEVFNKIHKNKHLEIQVDVETLDNFCKENKILSIDFLKIDTEGHEFAVLQGAKKLISEKKIRLIQFEFNEMNVISRFYMRDFIDFLSGYQLHRLLPDGLLPLKEKSIDSEIFGFQNIIAIENK